MTYINFSQARFMEQIVKYLRLQNKMDPEKYKLEDINKIINNLEGFCYGLSHYWLYLKNKGKEKEFYEKLRMINDWNGKKSGTSVYYDEHERKVRLNEISLEFFGKELNFRDNKLINAFEELISQISLLQYGTKVYDEEDLSLYKKTAMQNFTAYISKLTQEKEKFNKLFQLGFVFKDYELKKVLKKIIVPGALVGLGTVEHQIGVIFNDNKYIIYDPNYVCGYPKKIAETPEKRVDSIEEVVTEIKRIYGDKFNNVPSPNIALTIGVYSNKTNKFSINEEKVIDDIMLARSSSISIQNEANIKHNKESQLLLTSTGYNVSSINRAITSGNLKLVKHIISKYNAKITLADLLSAIKSGYEDVAEELVAHLGDIEDEHFFMAMERGSQFENVIKKMIPKLKKLKVDPRISEVFNYTLAQDKIENKQFTESVINELVKQNKITKKIIVDSVAKSIYKRKLARWLLTNNFVEDQEDLKELLRRAIEEQHIDIITLIINKKINAEMLLEVLPIACATGNKDIFNLIVKDNLELKTKLTPKDLADKLFFSFQKTGIKLAGVKLFRELGVDITKEPSILINAIHGKTKTLIKYLIENNAKIIDNDKNLIKAIVSVGDKEIAEWVLEKAPKLQENIQIAAIIGNINVIQRKMASDDSSGFKNNEELATAFCNAAKNGNLKVVKLLLKKKIANKDYAQALKYAINNEDDKLVIWLTDKCPDINILRHTFDDFLHSNNSNYLRFMLSIRELDQDFLVGALFLKYRTIPNKNLTILLDNIKEFDKKIFTRLIEKARKESESTKAELIQKRYECYKYMESHDHIEAMETALIHGFSKPVVSLLSKVKFKPQDIDKFLELAAMSGQEKNVEILINYGAKLRDPGFLCDLLAGFEQPDTVNVLLEKIKFPNNFLTNVLRIASQKGFYDVVETLINQRVPFDDYIIRQAEKNKHEQVANLLRNAKSKRRSKFLKRY